VVDISVARPGKHGHAKSKITGLDMFTGRKYTELCPSSHSMHIPFVRRTEWWCIGIGPSSRALSASSPIPSFVP